MSTIADYTGRKSDAAILRPRYSATNGLDTVSDLSMGQAGGAICTGIQKTVQKWLVIFLTQRGSVRYRPLRGTDFPSAIVNGSVRTDADLVTAFSIAADQVTEQLAAESLPTDPLDEQFVSATLISASVVGNGTATLSVKITTAAGQARTVVFPVGVGP